MKKLILIMAVIASVAFSQEVSVRGTATYGRTDTQEIVTVITVNGAPDPATAGVANLVPLIKVAQPVYNKATHKATPRLEWFPDRVERQWDVVALSQAELDAIQAEAADKAERQAVKALIADIKAGIGTNAERINRLEKAVRRLLKEVLR